MTSTFFPAFDPAVRPALLALAAATGLLLASSPAAAQVGACEDLKARLAQRISGGPGSYVMDAVPAAAAVPPGVKVIGTCGGGAWKVLFRRGSAPIVLDGATLAPAPVPTPTPAPTGSSSQGASSTATKPARAEMAGAAAIVPAAASAPISRVAVGKEGARPAEHPAAVVATPEPGRSASVEPSRPSSTSEPPVPPGEATQSRTSADATVSDTPSSGTLRTVIERHRLWLAGLAGLPLVAWLYAWMARRRAYDEQGLPRGPRLN
ncbi:DUF1161 domain-containing protein [Rhizobacter sp. LjRoot28]|uniref:DUF1161 domain-containing protein n=1 Tax=Rhizobacter sp. LjRoot28 TaxID=3342309 RepID=UPI003ECE293D